MYRALVPGPTAIVAHLLHRREDFSMPPCSGPIGHYCEGVGLRCEGQCVGCSCCPPAEEYPSDGHDGKCICHEATICPDENE